MQKKNREGNHSKARSGFPWVYGFNFFSTLSVPFEFPFKHEQVPGNTGGKEPTCQCKDIRDVGLIPRLGRSSGGGYGNPFQYSCLENPIDR